MRVDLPSGAWAEIRDPKKLRERHRRPMRSLSVQVIQQAMARGYEPQPGEDADKAAAKALRFVDPDLSMALESAAIGAFVETWSFDVPPGADAALDLETDDYDELVRVLSPLIAHTILKTSPNNNPDSPTVPSNGSGPRSEGTHTLDSAPSGGTTASSS